MWLTRYNKPGSKTTQTVSLGMRISNTVPYMATAHEYFKTSARPEKLT